MTAPKLTLYGALDLLGRPDARMVMTNVSSKDGNAMRSEYWISPSGVRVEPKIAEQIKAHPQVIGSKDGIWPGHDQTWRIGGE